MTNHKVSLPVIKRLPRYYRFVSELQASGVTTVSSSELAGRMGTTASQVRQDFNCFGGFGQQGIGYTVETLAAELEKLLMGDAKLDAILIGAGRLGQAITYFLLEEDSGCRITGLFDASPEKIGRTIHGLEVQDVAGLRQFCEANKPAVAVLCVPKEGARALSAVLFEIGITGFWNFSHYDLSTAQPGVVVENVHLGDSLMSLGYRVRHNTENE